jgi:SulP family sulfate permease
MELLVRMMRPHEGILGFVPGLAGMHDVDDHPHATQLPGLIVFRYDAPLFFANANDFYDKTITALETRPDARWLILNMEANVEVDATGLESLERVHEELHRRGVTLALSRVKHDLAVPMVRYGTMAVIGAENVYPTLPTAVLAFKDWYAAQPDAEPLD